MKLLFFSIFLLANTLSTFAQSKAEAGKFFKKGYSALDRQAYDEAIQFFEKAIQNDATGECNTGTKGKAHSELGYAYLRKQDLENAEKYFNQAIELDANDPFPRQNKAVLFTMQGEHNKAVQELETLIKIAPDFMESYVQRGFLYQKRNEKDKAKKDFETALKLNEKQKLLPPDLVKQLKQSIKELKKK